MANDLTRQTSALLKLTTAIRNLTAEMRPLMRAQEEVSEVVGNMAEETENAANIFTRFGDALGNPQGKLKGFIKFGYAFIPMFFRVKNAIELTSLAIGKFIDKIKDPNAGGLFLAIGRNFSKSFASAKDFFSSVFEGGVNSNNKVISLFTKMAVNVLSLSTVLLKYIFIGSLLIPLLISFFKSERFKKGIFNIIKALKVAFRILQTAFGFISEGVGLIMRAITGGGSFFENFKLVFEGLLSIVGGILTGLFGVLVATVGAGIAFIVGVIGLKLDKTIKQLKEGANKAIERNYGVISVLLVLGGLVTSVIGLIAVVATGIAALPIAIAGAVAVVAGGFLAAFNPFANGGVVGSGLQLVGEKGPEIVKLPTGSRVHSNKDSKKMMSGSTNNITVNVQGRIGASDTELRQIASKIGSMINKEVNRTTSSRGTIG